MEFDVISLECAKSTISNMYNNFSFKLKDWLKDMKCILGGN